MYSKYQTLPAHQLHCCATRRYLRDLNRENTENEIRPPKLDNPRLAQNDLTVQGSSVSQNKYARTRTRIRRTSTTINASLRTREADVNIEGDHKTPNAK